MRRTLALGAIWCWSSVAAAQENNAEALFNKGVDAMEAGNLGEACPALIESQRLDPRPGTLFTLAECESRWGRQASAFEHFQDYLRQVEALPAVQKSKHSARQQKASEAITRLAPRVAQVTLVGAPAGFEVFLDGRRMTAELLQAPAVVEPGEHWALVRGAGAEKTTMFTARLGEPQAVRLELPAPPPVASVAPVVVAAPAPAPVVVRASPLPFYVAAGVGVAGLTVGAIAGLVALSKRSTADQECAGLACSQAGLDAVHGGRGAATASTAGLLVGLLGAGAAAGLWAGGFSAPSRGAALRVAPAVGVAQLGLSAGGRW